MAPSKAQPSSPFLNREFNGELLLDEIDELQRGRVPQRALIECARRLGAVKGTPAQCSALVRQLASTRFSKFPALVSVLKRWATRLRNSAEMPLLAAHFERLAITAAMLFALQRAAPLLRDRRLPQ